MPIIQLRQQMTRHNMANLIVSDPYSIRYLTGYYTDPGERLLALVMTPETTLLVLNQLFPPAEVNDTIEVLTYHDGEAIIDTIAARLADGTTGIDKFWPSQFLLELMHAKSTLHPVAGSPLVDHLRAIKSATEIERMREASQLNDQIMSQIVQDITGNQTEAELVHQLLDYYQASGHSGVSFDPIIAFGANGADPHHTYDDSKPQRGDSVVVDIGGIYQGYASDMTRTFFYEEASEEAIRVYQTVRRANEAAIDAVRPGVPLRDIDLTARRIIEEAGYGEYFTHRLGHFIGQEAHEAGDVSQYNDQLTEVGQVFSIEPGIYLPGQLGVRIEDLVVVTEDGCEVLNRYSKELTYLPLDTRE